MPITLSELQGDLDNIMDQIISTGIPVDVERNGRKVRIVLVDSTSKLEKLSPRYGVINGDPESLVHFGWLS